MLGNGTWNSQLFDNRPEQCFSLLRAIAPFCVSVYYAAYSNIALMPLEFVIVPFIYAVPCFIADGVKVNFINLMNKLLTEI
jgi:hypothetical protein